MWPSIKCYLYSVPVPSLATGLSGPILDLERCIIDAMSCIEHWLRGRWQEHGCVVFLLFGGFAQQRLQADAGWASLFPGGFNNLNPEFMPLCVQAMVAAVEKNMPPTVRSILMTPKKSHA